MKPENVNPNNFKVIHVLYDNSDFAVAYGRWKNECNSLAMRWNGEEDAGYPKTFGNPMWFIVDDKLKPTIIKSLLGLPDSNKEKILAVLGEVM